MSQAVLENAPAVLENIPGEPDKWDKKWQAVGGGENRMIFTLAEPKTKFELLHRVYYVDLWLEMLRLQKGEGTPCVEMGSGRGTTSQYLAASGLPVTLVDLAPEGLAIAKSNFASMGLPEPQTILADIRNTGLPDSSFAVVHSVGTLEHLDFDPLDHVIAESWRLVCPGGLLYAVICNGETGGEMHRTNRTPEFYRDVATRFCTGNSELSCEPFKLAPSVYRLKVWKAI